MQLYKRKGKCVDCVNLARGFTHPWCNQSGNPAPGLDGTCTLEKSKFHSRYRPSDRRATLSTTFRISEVNLVINYVERYVPGLEGAAQRSVLKKLRKLQHRYAKVCNKYKGVSR